MENNSKNKKYPTGISDMSTINTPIEKELHKKIRIYCIENEISVKEFCYDAITKMAVKLRLI